MGNMVKITDYTEVTPNNEDFLLINQNGSNKKTTVEELLSDVNSSLSDLTNNKADKTQLLAVESGTFEPLLISATGSVVQSNKLGAYYKVGDLVFVKGKVTITSKNTASGTITIQGLPFVNNGYQSSLSIGLCSMTGITLLASYNSSAIQIMNGVLGLQASAITDSFDLFFSGTYKK